MTQKYYLCILFALVSILVYVFHRKVEHLTIEEKTEDRITKLEDDYSSLHAMLTSQEERVNASTAEVNEARAFINMPIDD